MDSILSILYVVPFILLIYFMKKGSQYWQYSRFTRHSTREKIGTSMLKIKPIKKEYEKEIVKYYDGICNKNMTKWKPYGPLFTQIPENGLSYEECDAIISKYTQLTLENIKDKQFSGTIYPLNTEVNTSWIHKDEGDDIYQQLQKLYAKIFINANLWNSLHDGEFPATSVINYQLVAMVSDLFGGKLNQTMGIVTTGGTQSIMTAARAYCNYGVLKKNLDPCNCVIIAPQTVHSSLMKAADAYKFQLVLLPVDKNGFINDNLLENVVNYYGQQVVAIFCSYPSYPYGTRDHYSSFARITKKYQVGLHIDCCLGGFVLNFENNLNQLVTRQPLEGLRENSLRLGKMERDCLITHPLLAIEGVTSVSADTHKNGLAPKGSSVLMCNDIYGQNLMYYSIYTTIDWPGGLYGTPKDEGSQSCIEAFCALITLLMIGRIRYEQIATKIRKTCTDLSSYLGQFKDIEVLGGPTLNVVAFKFKDHYKKGSTYKLGDLLKEKGFVLNSLLDDKIHLCITSRFALDETNLNKFKEAFQECYDQVIASQNQDIDGHARLYCSVDAMLVPQKTELSIGKYLENYFLGRLGVRDSIRYHFLSIINPFYNRQIDGKEYFVDLSTSKEQLLKE